MVYNFYSLQAVANVIITAWLHHLDSNEKFGGKANWKLHKDTAFHFEQIMEAVSYKNFIVQQLISHLTKRPRWTR